MKMNSALILAPHTDDAELGCGGTMARFLSEGIRLHVAVFSTAEDSLPEGKLPTMLRDEFVDAMGILGIRDNGFTVFDFPVRQLSYHRQRVLDELLKLRSAIRPDIVLVPSTSDLHQDHQVLCAEGLRAFKEISVWGYELPWNQVNFSANAFVTFGREHLESKWKALQAYKSQLELKRPYFTLSFIEGLARVRGVQVKSEFAEAFEVIRMRI